MAFETCSRIWICRALSKWKKRMYETGYMPGNGIFVMLEEEAKKRLQDSGRYLIEENITVLLGRL